MLVVAVLVTSLVVVVELGVADPLSTTATSAPTSTAAATSTPAPTPTTEAAAAGATNVSAAAMVPFVLPWKADVPGAFDLSFLNHRPAGSLGAIRAEPDGHFYAGPQRIRFFGINCDAGSQCEEKAVGEVLAARLARLGFNIVRFHHLDFRAFPTGLIRRGAAKSDELDPEARDRMDYFFAQLKQRGIYANINLLTGRQFRAADGLPAELEQLDWKERHTAAFFYPPMIRLQEEYARKLLTHRNPYTGLTYAEDPAVAVVEIINEHGLLNSYFDGKLDKLPPVLRRELQGQWNQWLKKRYSNADQLRKAWSSEDPLDLEKVPLLTLAYRTSRSSARLHDWIRFLWDTESRYYRHMRRFLKEELRVRGLVVGSIVQNSTPNIMAQLDAIDLHEYWNHPRFVFSSPEKRDWYISDTSLVHGLDHKFGYLALFRVAGKPLSVSEFNHCLPSPYAGEGPLVLAAMAALQDWDAVYLFAWGRAGGGRIEGFFNVASSPTILANVPVAAMLFRRGDVSAARQVLQVRLPPSAEPALIAQYGAAWGLAYGGQLGLTRQNALVHRVALQVGETKADEPPPRPTNVPVADRYVSDTGELRWDRSRKDRPLLSVNSPRTKLLVGFADQQTVPLGEVTVMPGNTLLGWCTVGLTLLEGEAFSRPCRALLVVTGKADNTEMVWQRYGPNPGPDGKPNLTLKSWGQAPSRIETVPVTLYLPGPAQRWTVHALDEHGERSAAVPVTERAEGRAVLTIGPTQRTLWYELVGQ